MAAYDNLPPTARKAFQNAVFDWAAQPVVTRWRKGQRGFRTGAEIARTVRQWDNTELATLRKERRARAT
jgi:predicted amidophosphoribosyltransferase